MYCNFDTTIIANKQYYTYNTKQYLNTREYDGDIGLYSFVMISSCRMYTLLWTRTNSNKY